MSHTALNTIKETEMKRFLYAIAILVGCGFGQVAAESSRQAVWLVGPPPADWQQAQFAPPQAPANTGAPVVVNNPPDTNKVDSLPSWGTVISGLLVTLIGIYGAPIVTAVKAFLYEKTGAAGAIAKVFLGDRLDSMIQNGMLKAAQEVGKFIDGRWVITDPTSFQARVAQYIQDHGSELIKRLGGATGTPQFFDAVKARTLRQFADPAFPVDLGPHQEDHEQQFRAPFDQEQFFARLDQRLRPNDPHAPTVS